MAELHAGRLWAWGSDATSVRASLGPTLDPDWLLGRPACTLIKVQRRVMVGHVEVGGRVLYLKRYNPYAVRAVVRASIAGSPARSAARAARRLAAHGFGVPQIVAVSEWRLAGIVGRSFLVTEQVPGGVTSDVAWRESRGGARRRLAERLAGLFRRLHEDGVYHADLKDVNIMIRGDGEPVLLDLERVRFGRRVSRTRRVKNLVQLDRTLGRLASRAARLRFLAHYLGLEQGRGARRRWVRRILTAAARKDRRRRPSPDTGRAGVSAMLVCQNEAAALPGALATLAWCDEVVMVDGGSHDATVELARSRGVRVIENPWPGFIAQKQKGLEHCRMPWVLNVDADERVTSELAARIERELADVAPDVDGFSIPRLVPYLGRWWFRGGWYPRRILRLMRREATRWGGEEPHDRPEVPGRVVPLDEAMVHYSYAGTSEHLRTVRNLTRVAAERPASEQRVGLGRLVGEPAWRFVRSYVLRRGALEGMPGLFLATTDALYVLVRWARVWERRLG